MEDSYGIVASVDELVRQRSQAGRAQIAPAGRVRTLQSGSYRSAFRGRGMEFDESRAYQAGDDVRAIDWRVTARTGRVHTKMFQEERERPVLFLLDARPMMRFGTRDAFKSVVAARVAATLAWAARDGGDRVGGTILTGSGHLELAPQRSRARMLTFLRAISTATADTTAGQDIALGRAVERMRRVARPGTLVFVVSDFHDLDDDAERQLARLAQRCDVFCIMIHDPVETAPPQRGSYRISNGRGVLALPTGDREWHRQYTARFEVRRARLTRVCRQYRAGLLILQTGDDHARIVRPDGIPAQSRRTARGAVRA